MACANCRSRRRARAILNAPSGTPRLVRESPWSGGCGGGVAPRSRRRARDPGRQRPRRSLGRVGAVAPGVDEGGGGAASPPGGGGASSSASARATPRGRRHRRNRGMPSGALPPTSTRAALFSGERRHDGAGDETSNDRSLPSPGTTQDVGAAARRLPHTCDARFRRRRHNMRRSRALVRARSPLLRDLCRRELKAVCFPRC